MSPKDIIDLIKKEDVKMVDLRFADLFGTWQHFTVPSAALDEGALNEGLGFDGSSIRGWKAINNSDMIIKPDLTSAFMDPFTKEKTLIMVVDIEDPVTGEKYDRDPRNIARKAADYLKSSGIADTAYFGPECEFFVFDDIRYDSNAHEAYYHIDSNEGIWNSGRIEEGGNKGYKIRHKEGYFPVPPNDTLMDLRTEMVLNMQKCGIEIEAQHHEVATAGQCEIDMRFDTIISMADKVMKYKYCVKNTANLWGKIATFMPKPIFADNGTGMHVHQSLWNGSSPLFAGNGHAGLSELGLYYTGGILKHARAITAFTNPSTNSYKRLVPGYEAPVNLAFSSRNRSASIRIPMYSQSPKAKRIEVRFPDPSSNPYLSFAVMLMAGIDGIKNKIDPGTPLDHDLFEMSPAELAKIPSAPGSLDEALDALKADHDFLLQGGVFNQELIDLWIDWKHTKEAKQVDIRPHPYEFFLYFDC